MSRLKKHKVYYGLIHVLLRSDIYVNPCIQQEHRFTQNPLK